MFNLDLKVFLRFDLLLKTVHFRVELGKLLVEFQVVLHYLLLLLLLSRWDIYDLGYSYVCLISRLSSGRFGSRVLLFGIRCILVLP